MKFNVSDLKNRLRNAQNISESPYPFIGNYPTRIYWQVGTVLYCGKPHPYQLRRYEKLRRKTEEGIFEFLEFDKKSPILWYRKGYWSNNGTLWTAYFPWGNLPSSISNRRKSDLGPIKVYTRLSLERFGQYCSWYEQKFGKPAKTWNFPLPKDANAQFI